MTNDVVVGVFDTPQKAGEAVRLLQENGFSEDDIGLVAPQKGPKAATSGSSDDLTSWQASAAVGAVTGGTIALALTAIAVPGAGTVLAGGTLATMFLTGGTGALAGGLIGSLVGVGIPSETAAEYEKLVLAGNAVVTVKAKDRTAVARDVLRRSGASQDFITEGATALR